MHAVLRRMRAALFLSLFWALLAGGLGLLLGLLIAVRHGADSVLSAPGQWWSDQHDLVWNVVTRWAEGGAALGVVFSAILALAERGRGGRRLSTARTWLLGSGAALAVYAVGLARYAMTQRTGWIVLVGDISPAAIVLVIALGGWLARVTMLWAGRGLPPSATPEIAHAERDEASALGAGAMSGARPAAEARSSVT